MPNLVTTPTYSNIYQIETADDVLGGTGALANEQAQALGNRDDFLADVIGSGLFSKLVYVHTNVYSASASEKGTAFIHDHTIPVSLILPPIASVDDNSVFALIGHNRSNIGYCSIGLSGSDVLNYQEVPGGITGQYNVWDGAIAIKKFPGATEWTCIMRWQTLQAGAMCWWPTGKQPIAWLLCNGSFVPTVSYPELFNKIGYSFGGSGSTFFLPSASSGVTGMSLYIHG